MSPKYSSWLFTASKYVFFLSKTWLAQKNLSIQIFNLSIQVSLSLKLIVQVTLAIIYCSIQYYLNL